MGNSAFTVVLSQSNVLFTVLRCHVVIFHVNIKDTGRFPYSRYCLGLLILTIRKSANIVTTYSSIKKRMSQKLEVTKERKPLTSNPTYSVRTAIFYLNYLVQPRLCIKKLLIKLLRRYLQSS